MAKDSTQSANIKLSLTVNNPTPVIEKQITNSIQPTLIIIGIAFVVFMFMGIIVFIFRKKKN